MLVREIMSSPAYQVHHQASPQHAVEIMAHRGLSCLPVVTEDGALVGVISEADVLSVRLHQDPRAHLRTLPELGETLPGTVADLMTPHPTVATEQTDVAEVAETFARTSFKSLPVLRGRRVVGVVSRSDVVAALARTDEEIRTEANEALHLMGSPSWQATVTGGEVEVVGPASAHDRALAASLVGTLAGARRVSVRERPRPPGLERSAS